MHDRTLWDNHLSAITPEQETSLFTILIVQAATSIYLVMLFREIQDLGYQGSLPLLRHYLYVYRIKPKQELVIRFETSAACRHCRLGL